MVGFYGLPPVSGPANVPSPEPRSAAKDGAAARTPQGDAVNLSSEARDAAHYIQEARHSEPETDIVAKKVAEAREQLEKRTHEVLDVVRIVAARISPYI